MTHWGQLLSHDAPLSKAKCGAALAPRQGLSCLLILKIEHAASSAQHTTREHSAQDTKAPIDPWKARHAGKRFEI
jgi:uncharacterized membrane-anchored protein